MNDETAKDVEDLVALLKKLHRQGYALYYSDAVYLVHENHTVELAQRSAPGAGVFVTGFWVHHAE